MKRGQRTKITVDDVQPTRLDRAVTIMNDLARHLEQTECGCHAGFMARLAADKVEALATGFRTFFFPEACPECGVKSEVDLVPGTEPPCLEYACGHRTMARIVLKR